MTLSNDIARCDGLLPMLTQHNGKPMTLWAFDCPRREKCARYEQLWRDDPAIAGELDYISHFHAPGDTCPDFIADGAG